MYFLYHLLSCNYNEYNIKLFIDLGIYSSHLTSNARGKVSLIFLSLNEYIDERLYS